MSGELKAHGGGQALASDVIRHGDACEAWHACRRGFQRGARDELSEGAGDQPPASRLHTGVDNVMTNYTWSVMLVLNHFASAR